MVNITAEQMRKLLRRREVADNEFVADVFVPGLPEVSGNLKINYNAVRSMKQSDWNNPSIVAKRVLRWSNSAKLKKWKLAICQKIWGTNPEGIYLGPVYVNLTFYLRMAKDTRRRWLKGRVPYLWRIIPPDLDKLVRAVGDGITESGIIKDDGQIVQIVCQKVHSRVEGGEGVRIKLISATGGRPLPAYVWRPKQVDVDDLVNAVETALTTAGITDENIRVVRVVAEQLEGSVEGSPEVRLRLVSMVGDKKR